MIRKAFIGAVFTLALCIVACARPVGVRRAVEEKVYSKSTESVLSGKQTSVFPRQFLQRLSFAERFEEDPQGTLADLHKGLGGADDHDRLFALAELSFSHARRSSDPQYFLAAALYAYVFLFPDDDTSAPLPYDPRLLLAMDIYNRSVANGLRIPKGEGIDLSSRRLALPFGHMDLSVDPSGFNYGGYNLIDFIPLGDFEIYGFRNHYRKPGIGAPLAARVETVAGRSANTWMPSQVKIPVTAFLRFEQPRRALSDGRLSGKIEVYDVDVAPTVAIDERFVPLAADPSTALAYRLNNSPLWDLEIAGFRSGDFTLFGDKKEGALGFLTPYRPGRIPVVFVHGTASSPGRWAEMVNELMSDSNIASRYQFWFFVYNSGNPIPLSAMHLRENLQAAVKDIDPEGKDTALRNMVVIGHSQGGLLTKMTAINSGNKFWENASKQPFDQAKLPSETKELLRRSLFVTPLPFVTRTVFICTPHRGSFLTENLIGSIGRKLINIPATMTKVGLDLASLNPGEAKRKAFRIPTALDNMDWSNPFLKTLAALPIQDGVHVNSIVAVKGDGSPEKGDDGVVRYNSAHLEKSESELIVRSGHSTQSYPPTIEEVRRILYEHVSFVQIGTKTKVK